jgi:hypothetical protein
MASKGVFDVSGWRGVTGTTSQATAARGLRASLYWEGQHQGRNAFSASALPFTLGLMAVVCEFCISGNTLNEMGLSYSQLGGNPLVKFLPGTYLAVFGAVASLFGSSGQLASLFSKAPALLLFCTITLFCIVFASVNVGLTGAGVYVDTYISAGALAIIMANASNRQRAILARLVLALCIANVLISFAEYVHQEHIIPMDFTDETGKKLTDNQSDEFRPAALYTHSLTGAMATAFGVFLVFAINLRFVTAGVCFLVLMVGLLGFGGRAALLVTVGMLSVRMFVTLGRDMLKGRVNGRVLAIAALSVAILGPLTGFLLYATPVGARIAARAYYDDSAEVRADQWGVFAKLTPQQLMFGTPATDLDLIYGQIGLVGVENPFILVFLNLGIIGVPIFTGGLLAFFLYLYRTYPDSKWVLMAALLILSSSNSIGVKSPDLFMMTACAISMKGGSRVRLPRVTRKVRITLPFPHLPAKGLSPEGIIRRPVYYGFQGMRRLSSNVVRRDRIDFETPDA